MSAKLHLEVTDGPMKGVSFPFDEHDTFLFGRMDDCHACLPQDPEASRHHFILEANPPDARIRDLGSRNGTYVNDVKYGGREKGETPEQGAKRHYPEVDLKDGDRIKVGQTVLSVHLEPAAVCSRCHTPIADKDRRQCAWIGGAFLCTPCRKKLAASNQKPKPLDPVRCQKCGKDVSAEVGPARRGDYICNACRNNRQADPMDVLKILIQQLGMAHPADQAPQIAGYEVEKRLGVGGFGAVYLARRKKDNQPVAIKVMLSRVAVDERSRKKFLDEVNLTRALRHEHVVSLLDSGSAGGAFYFIMDYCEGGGIDDLMNKRGGKLPLSDAAPIILQALDGLAYIHANDIVHRDLKPANILLAGPGNRRRARIADLGLAKNFQKAGFSGMTVTGTYAGTPVFMPREQLTNFKYVKPISDLWSMGATLYNMLTGQFPRDFPKGKDRIEVILYGGAVPIRQRDPAIPPKLAAVIDRALADDTNVRYQTATDLRNALAAAI